MVQLLGPAIHGNLDGVWLLESALATVLDPKDACSLHPPQIIALFKKKKERKKKEKREKKSLL